MKKLFTLILSVLSLSIAAQTRQLSPGHPDRTAKTDLKKSGKYKIKYKTDLKDLL